MNQTDGAGDVLYAFGPFVADPVKGQLRRDGEIVALPPRAFDVLIALIERRGQLLLKQELFDRVWPGKVIEENNLARHISTLRRVLQECVGSRDYIVTVTGRGYRFVATVQALAREDQPHRAVTTIAVPESVQAAGQSLVGSSRLEPAIVAPSIAETSMVEPSITGTSLVEPSAVKPGRIAGSVRSRRAWFGLVAAVLLVVSFAGTQALLSRSGERLGVPHRRLSQLTFSPGVQSEPTWSPDGHWIAYSSDHAGNSDIWVQPITAENPVRLTSSAENDWQPAWSPDGKYVAFRSERDGGGIYVVPAQGGRERKIANFGYVPQWSPDGLRILFYGPLRTSSARPMDLYVVGLDGSPPREVLTDLLSGFQSFFAGWYPQGQRVSVSGARRDAAGSGMWTVSLSGRDLVKSDVAPDVAQRLKEADVVFGHFVWSPAADALFFEGSSDGLTNLWRVTVNPRTLGWNAGPDRLTTGAELNENISVSADGTRIAFSLKSKKTRLWTVPFDAVAGRTLGLGEPLTSEGADAPYDISRDGTQLVYRAIRQGKQELWRRSLATGESRLLLTAGSISAPRWSPDGTRLVYRRDVPSNLPGSPVARTVAVMNSDGQGERFLTAPRPMSAAEQMAPFDWSADGTKVLSACPAGLAGNIAICMFSLAGDPEMHRIAARVNYALFEAQFSPDGRWVCFNAVTTPGTSTIYVAPAGGGDWTAITDGRFWQDKPRWAPDGRTIYFTVTRAGFVNVWGRRFDAIRGVPLTEPFPVTTFETPARMLMPEVRQLHIALVRKHLVLPLTDVTASIWMLDHINQ